MSDLDDTIKVTNSDDFLESFGYGLARRKVYLGIPEFLSGARTYVERLNLVSASPRVIKWNVKRLLRKNDITVDNIVLNGNIRRPGHFEFKIGAIKKIMESTTDAFILLGDDVGDDPEIYDELMRLYPGRILASYIHVVNQRPVPESVQLYYTSYELAVKEHIAGRLPREAITKIAEIFMNEKDLESVFPDFAVCPKFKTSYAWLNETQFSEEAEPIVEKLVQYCRSHRN